MPTLSFYDPALCCSSGVCGPSVDPELVRLQADLEWIKKQGVSVERFNLAQQPADFAANEIIKTVLQQSGTDALPVVLLDGKVVASRFYPTREQLRLLCGLPQAEAACGCGPKGCC
jgi:hypothetical protein